jgi:hypothetical protein
VHTVTDRDTLQDADGAGRGRCRMDEASVERLLESGSIAALDLKYAGGGDGGAEWLCRVLRLLCSNRSVTSVDMWGALQDMR